MSEYTINVEPREGVGKGASRRLRRLEARVPAVLYGGGKTAFSLKLLQKDLFKALEDESIFSKLITLQMGDKTTTALIKDLQRHPAREDIINHVDFLRIEPNKPVIVNVPLRFTHEEACFGVKQQGGAISKKLSKVEVRCLPEHLPDYITVDMLKVKVKDTVRLSDLQLPEGVELTTLKRGPKYNVGVVTVRAVKKRD